jgi:hypothetical protein
MTFDSTKYQAYFEDARKRAQHALDPAESAAWLRVASKWLKRLAQAERRELDEVLTQIPNAVARPSTAARPSGFTAPRISGINWPCPPSPVADPASSPALTARRDDDGLFELARPIGRRSAQSPDFCLAFFEDFPRARNATPI